MRGLVRGVLVSMYLRLPPSLLRELQPDRGGSYLESSEAEGNEESGCSQASMKSSLMRS